MFLKKIIKKILWCLPKRNLILLESIPDCTDNTQAVFQEMLKRGLNKRYTMVWILNDPPKNREKIKNVWYIPRSSPIVRYLTIRAKMLISCNNFLIKNDERQFSFYLLHGGAMKDCGGTYNAPETTDKLLVFSEYLAPLDAQNMGVPAEKMVVLGFPRNDVLIHGRIDLKSVFREVGTKKVIYWLPTFRQHKNGRAMHSTISMPILYNAEIAERINAHAKQRNVLLMIKPHPQQDVSRITSMKLSNLLFINNDYLISNNITNYELLASVDAMLTDYSSVYYDYLLTDRPIGLCWDDFESYNAREGFVVDLNVVAAGGEKIYNENDLCGFIDRVASGEDHLAAERRKVRKLIHKFEDDQSSRRVVDYIESVLKCY